MLCATSKRICPPGSPPDPEAKPGEKFSRMSLVLDFITPPTTQAYEYSDQNPVFGTLIQLLPERQRSFMQKTAADLVKRAQFQSSIWGLMRFCQVQVMYPPEALRAHEQGTVFASFEVTESGTIEYPEILGSTGRSLNAEVLRVLALLPVATAPAQLHG